MMRHVQLKRVAAFIDVVKSGAESAGRAPRMSDAPNRRTFLTVTKCVGVFELHLRLLFQRQSRFNRELAAIHSLGVAAQRKVRTAGRIIPSVAIVPGAELVKIKPQVTQLLARE